MYAVIIMPIACSTDVFVTLLALLHELHVLSCVPMFRILVA